MVYIRIGENLKYLITKFVRELSATSASFCNFYN